MARKGRTSKRKAVPKKEDPPARVVCAHCGQETRLNLRGFYSWHRRRVHGRGKWCPASGHMNGSDYPFMRVVAERQRIKPARARRVRRGAAAVKASV